MPMTFIKVEPRPRRDEMVECEKCPELFLPEELDEEGYCSECAEENEGHRSLDRYFNSISR